MLELGLLSEIKVRIELGFHNPHLDKVKTVLGLGLLSEMKVRVLLGLHIHQWVKV